MASDLWKTVPLGDVLERVKRPVTLKDGETYRTLGVRWRARGVFEKRPLDRSKISAKTLYAVEPEDVIYSRLFAWRGSFGVVEREQAGAVVSSEFPTYRATKELLPSFFHLWASQSAVWEAAELFSTSSTPGSRNRLKEDDFLGLEIDLPPMPEQERIVTAVTALDHTRHCSSAELETATALYVALREDLITSGDFDVRLVGDVLRTVGQGKAFKSLDRPPLEGEWAVIKQSAVRPALFRPSEAKALDPSVSPVPSVEVRSGDVIMARANTAERVGHVCRVHEAPPRLLVNDMLFRLHFETSLIDPGYAVFALGTTSVRDEIESLASGTSSSMKTINQQILRNLEIVVPASLDVQRQIGRTLQIALERVEALRAERQSLENLRQSFVQTLLSGENEGQKTPAVFGEPGDR